MQKLVKTIEIHNLLLGSCEKSAIPDSNNICESDNISVKLKYKYTIDIYRSIATSKHKIYRRNVYEKELGPS